MEFIIFWIIFVHGVLGFCPKSTYKRSFKIVGGDDASIDKFPFIGFLYNTRSKFMCGASIINKHFAITAAHCTDRNSPRDFYLQVGASNLREGGKKHRITRIIQYPTYTFPYDDISLLRVTEKFHFDDNVGPIAIHPRLVVPDGSEVTAIGWGKTNSSGESSDQLKEVELEIWPHEECQQFWQDDYEITEQMICAGSRSSTRGSCEGDSGGPLIYEGLMFTEAKIKRPPKIVGGEPAILEEFPFIVALLTTIFDYFFCGGSIISEKYALTAAHCVNGKSPESFYLQVGSTNLTNGGVEHTVREIIEHEDYHYFPAHDIALMEVDVTFQFNRRVQPIAIYPRLDVPDGSKVTVMGWGYTDPDDYWASSVLMKVELEVWPLDECHELYEKIDKPIEITDKMICAGRRDKSGGSCQGDSGGPLIFEGKLIGIVSGGFDDCGVNNQPEGYYTRVAAYKEWIDSHAVRRRRRKGSKCMARSSYSRRRPKY